MNHIKQVRIILGLLLPLFPFFGCATFPKPTEEKSSLLIFVFDRQDNRKNPNWKDSWSDVVEIEGLDSFSAKSATPADRIIAVPVRPGSYTLKQRVVTKKWSNGYDERKRYLNRLIDVPADAIVLVPIQFNLNLYNVGSWREDLSFYVDSFQERVAGELSDTIGFSEWIGKLFIGFGKHIPRMTLSQDEYRVRVVSTPPGADVIVDNEKRGETPTLVETSAGKHLVEVRKEGFASWRNYVDIDSDQEIAMTLKTTEQLAGEGDERAQLKQNQYGLSLTPFRNLGGEESEHLQNVFHESLSATLAQDERILVFKTPGDAPKTDDREATMTPDFSVAYAQGADLLVVGDYFARAEDLLIHASLFDVQKESVKADILYSSKTGLSIFDSIDEMTRNFGEAVDNVLPESGKQILERKEIVETEITSLEKKVTQKDIISRRGKRRHDLSLVAGMEVITDSVQTELTGEDGDETLRFLSGVPYGIALSYTYHFVNALGFIFQADYLTAPNSNSDFQEAPVDWAFFAGPELTFSGLSLDVYARFLGQYRMSESVMIQDDGDPLFETGDFTYYGFSVDAGFKYYLMKRYSSPGWYANFGIRYTPYLIREGGDEPNDQRVSVPLESFVYFGLGVRL